MPSPNEFDRCKQRAVVESFRYERFVRSAESTAVSTDGGWELALPTQDDYFERVRKQSSLVGREFDLNNPTFTIDIAAQQEYILLHPPLVHILLDNFIRKVPSG
jgi:hypothetical protein